jgi:hypothetical protein
MAYLQPLPRESPNADLNAIKTPKPVFNGSKDVIIASLNS